MSRRAISVIGMAVVASGVLAFGIEGRIPIFAPTTITAPGTYIVTQDISVTTGSVLTIRSSNVTLDLNGNSLSRTGGSCSGRVITIDSSVPVQDLIIRNGRLVCGGIADTGFTNRVRIRIENVDISGAAPATGVPGIEFNNADHVEILRCSIHDMGNVAVSLNALGTELSARIIDNTIQRVIGGGISLLAPSSSVIKNNIIRDFGCCTSSPAGIEIDGLGIPGGNIIEGNTISSFPSGTGADGIRIGATFPPPSATSPANVVVRNNVVHNGRYGIWSMSDHTRLDGNYSSANGSDGIRVGDGTAGSRGFLEGNQTQGNGGCGIRFTNTNSHAYRNNVVRVNAGGGICGGGPPNTDAGGNIL